MLFQTFDFFVFFSLFLFIYSPLKRTKYSIYIIAGFSVFFYAYWNWHYLFLLLVTVIMDYMVGILLENQKNKKVKRILLVVSLFVNFGILFWYKYLNFILDLVLPAELSTQYKIPDMLLPLGISFYVFQSVSYVVDVYQGRMRAVRRFVEYLSFVTFFPHLIAGPIQRGWQLLPQIINPEPVSPRRITTAVYYFCKGFFYKGLGDLISTFHNPVFDNLQSAEPGMVLIAVFSFGFQIYLDFCGYSEMAIGIARLLGVDLIRNFEEPYLSISPQEFWRRWHISLSTWLKDYVYINLGGNREGGFKQTRNIIFVMVVCGIWHGAGIGFIVWGLIHGILILATILIHKVLVRAPLFSFLKSSFFGRVIGWFLTFIFVNYAWLYFRLPEYADFSVANQKIHAFLVGSHDYMLLLKMIPVGLPFIMILVLILDFIQRKVRLIQFQEELTAPGLISIGVVSALFFGLGLLLGVGTPSQQFIYFQF